MSGIVFYSLLGTDFWLGKLQLILLVYYVVPLWKADTISLSKWSFLKIIRSVIKNRIAYMYHSLLRGSWYKSCSRINSGSVLNLCVQLKRKENQILRLVQIQIYIIVNLFIYLIPYLFRYMFTFFNFFIFFKVNLFLFTTTRASYHKQFFFLQNHDFFFFFWNTVIYELLKKRNSRYHTQSSLPSHIILQPEDKQLCNKSSSFRPSNLTILSRLSNCGINKKNTYY